MPQPRRICRHRRMHILRQPHVQSFLLSAIEVDSRTDKRGQGVLCTQIHGHEVSGLLSGLQQHLRIGRNIEAPIRRGSKPGGCCGYNNRYATRLRRQRSDGLSGASQPPDFHDCGVWHRVGVRPDFAACQPRTRLRVLATRPCRDSRPWHSDVRTYNIRIAGRIG